MGWDFQQCTKKELIKELLDQGKPLDYHLDNYSKTESVLYMLVDTGPKYQGKRVLIFLIEKRIMEGKIWWGYKDMIDTMGPCACTCPLRLIEACTPIEDETVAEWHKEVRAYWASNKLGPKSYSKIYK
jgi:hypothetical protein